MGANSKEYNKSYYLRKIRAARIARDLESPLCGVCVVVPWAGHWGPLEIPACDACLGALAIAEQAQQSHVLDLQRGADALDQDAQDAWEGDKVVHIVEKGQGGVWGELGELGELAEIPGVQALCRVVSPPGPLRLDMLQPKELKQWPLCPACIAIYAGPPGLAENENHHCGYAIPTTAALSPDEVPVT